MVPSEVAPVSQKPSPPKPRQAHRRLPVVSIENIFAANEAGSHELDEVLDQAFGVHGLGILCVTSGERFSWVRRAREALLPLAPALEALPEESRELITERGTVNVNNYSRGIDGHRSGFYFHPSVDAPAECESVRHALENDECDPAFYAPNLWPDELPELREQARECAPLIVEVGQQVAKLVDNRLTLAMEGYRCGTLEELVRPSEDCNHKCRLLCYHDFKTEERRAADRGMWAPPHKDTGLFTALVPSVFLAADDEAHGASPEPEGNALSQDQAAVGLPAAARQRVLHECPDPEVGLYVRDGHGAIVQIKPPQGVRADECLFLQAGEALGIVSGGFYHATEHCVRGPPRANVGYVRATLAVFMQPHAHEYLHLPRGLSFQDVAKTCVGDGMYRMFLQSRPVDSSSICFSDFCQRNGF